MVLTASNLVPLGTLAPAFSLFEPLTGQIRSLKESQGPIGTLIVFFCNHCPFVVHIREEIVGMAAEYKDKGIHTIAINSNDSGAYPEDSPGKMIEFAKAYAYSFPYLFDETQETAKNFKAACTPDFFLYNSRNQLVYRGQMDDSRPGSDTPVTGKDLREAMDALIHGTQINKDQKPSMGCNIKWKR